MSRLPHKLLAFFAALPLALPVQVVAQTIGYGDVSDVGGEPSVTESPATHKPERPGKGSGGRRFDVVPYIEALQVVEAEFSPEDQVFTYSRLAAGVDAVAAGQHNGASVSIRYERRIAWDSKTEDGDLISGIANGYATIVPGLQIHAGALATRTRIDNDGAAVFGPLGEDDAITHVYSLYAGPSLATRTGDVSINANYRFGYTKVEEPDVAIVGASGEPIDIFDESKIHVADITAGVAPYEVLPVGIRTGASYYREDISNLDQRIEDMQARAIVTVPVSHNAAVTGAVGYEKVEVSSRDALRDANGDPVIGSDGRFVTDKDVPRTIAYDVDGLIWGAGVMWGPSRRTSLEAHVGRRYGSTSVSGSFSYAPSERSAFNFFVYDNVAGFGGQVNRVLADLPTDFAAVRNPLTGDITGCVDSLEEGSCISGALGSLRSATFRARGGGATYAMKFGKLAAGIGAGYDRRKFIAAPGTVLAVANDIVDENYWLAAYLNGTIDNRSGFLTNLYANWIETGGTFAGDLTAFGATVAYYRSLTNHLVAAAALGVDGVSRDKPIEDIWSATAQVGMRYSF